MSELTKRQTENLVSLMAELIMKYKQDEKVECIYLTPYKDNDNIFYNFVVLFSDSASVDKFNTKAAKTNAKFRNEKLISKFGGQISEIADYADKYEECALNPRRLRRVRTLLSSKILYTKKGYGRHYYRVAHQFDKDNTMEKFDSIIDTGITLEKIKEKQI